MAATVQGAEVADLVSQLKGNDPELRRAAAKELGEAGADAKTAVPALSQALKDKDWHVRRFSALGLWPNSWPRRQEGGAHNLVAVLNDGKEQKKCNRRPLRRRWASSASVPWTLSSRWSKTTAATR